MFEGVPNYPTMSRFWEVIDKHQVNTFYTAPTAIRSLMGAGEGPVKKTSRKDAMLEVEDAVIESVEHRRPVELSPQPKHIRRLQHLYIERSGLKSESKGSDPMRRIVIYPR